jgi:hypothetical protein
VWRYRVTVAAVLIFPQKKYPSSQQLGYGRGARLPPSPNNRGSFALHTATVRAAFSRLDSNILNVIFNQIGPVFPFTAE